MFILVYTLTRRITVLCPNQPLCLWGVADGMFQSYGCQRTVPLPNWWVTETAYQSSLVYVSTFSSPGILTVVGKVLAFSCAFAGAVQGGLFPIFVKEGVQSHAMCLTTQFRVERDWCIRVPCFKKMFISIHCTTPVPPVVE